MRRQKLYTRLRLGAGRSRTDAIIALLIVFALIVFLAALSLLVADDLSRVWR